MNDLVSDKKNNLNISVIIPVYNAEPFLPKAVNSALQFPEVKEVILIEDGSKDNSLKVAQNLEKNNDRVKLYQHENGENLGAGATRNLGLSYATQEYIAFLDADDYYLPNRFDKEKELFENPKIEGVFGAIGVDFLTESGKNEFTSKFKNTELTTFNKAAEGEEVFLALIGLRPDIGCFFSLDGLTIRKSSFNKSGIVFNHELKVHQDQDFITKLAYYLYLKSGSIDKAISIRGIHDENRILKIKNYSKKYNMNQYMRWKSLFDWQKNMVLNKEVKQEIKIQYNTFDIGTSKGLGKILKIVKSVFRDPKILKMKYRYNFTPKN